MKNDNDKKRAPYEAPKVETVSSAKILEELGPAVAGYGKMGYHDSAW